MTSLPFGLTWVHPASGHSTAEASCLVLGQLVATANTPLPAELWVSCQPVNSPNEPTHTLVTLTPEGTFAHALPLPLGQAILTLGLPPTAEHLDPIPLAQRPVSRIPPWGVADTVDGWLTQWHPLWGEEADDSHPEPYAAQAGDSVPISVVCDTTWHNVVLQWHAHTPHGQTSLPDTVGLHRWQGEPLPLPLPPALNVIDLRQAVFAHSHWGNDQHPLDADTLALWQGEVSLPATLPPNTTHLTLSLHATPAHGHATPPPWEPPNTSIALLPSPQVVTLAPSQSHSSTVEVRTSPSPHGMRLSPWLAGTQVNVVQQRGAWLGCSLSPTLPVVWAYGGKAESLPLPLEPQAKLTPQPLHTVVVSPHQSEDATTPTWQVRCPLPAGAVPYHVDVTPSHLNLTLYGVDPCVAFVEQQGLPALGQRWWLTTALSVPSSHTLQLSLGLPCTLIGWHMAYEQGAMVLTFRGAPPDWRHWHIALDAGHGGDETGALALNGTPEKELNLAMAHRLAGVLQSMGFNHVNLLRHTDTAMSLAQRQTWLESHQPHMVLSLHHNALPNGRDPQAEQGASTYYYHAHAQGLAMHVLQALGQVAMRPTYGVLFDSLAMTRPTVCQAVLVELGFIIHPTETLQLQTPAVQAAMAKAMAWGIKASIRHALKG
jgi:N-acetylmuramoyl-L-alanine amidase